MTERKTTKKPKTRFTSQEVIHKWCNLHEDLVKAGTIKSSVFEADEKRLYYHDKLIAYRNEKYISIKKFDNTGAYHSGYTDYSISRAMPNTNYLVTDKIIKDDFDENEKISILKNYIIDKITPYLRLLLFNKNTVYDNRIQVCHTLESLDNEEILALELDTIKLILPIDKLLEQEISTKITYKIYQCWTYNGSYNGNFKFILKDLPNLKTIYFTEEELKLIDFKSFRYRNKYKVVDYRYNVTHKIGINSFHEDLKLYNESPEKYKEKLLEYKKIEDDKVKKYYLDREVKRNKDKYDKFFSRFNSNDYLISIDIKILNFNTFKLIGNTIISDFGVKFDIEEGKKAFKIFKGLLESTQIAGYNINLIGEDIFLVPDFEDKTFKPLKCKYIKVGCHRVPYFVFEHFIQYYKLDWNE